MKKVPREAVIVVVLLAVLGGILILANWNVASGSAPFSVHNSQPSGVSIYSQWLADQGFHVSTLEGGNTFGISDNPSLLMMIDPTFDDENTGSQDMTTLINWVKEGHKAAIVINSYDPGSDDVIASALNVSIFQESSRQLTAAQPLGPASAQNIQTTSNIAFQVKNAEFVGYYTLPGSIENQDFAVLSLRIGSGEILLASTPDILTNYGLNQGDNSHLAYDFAALAPGGGSIEFDEYHHGFHTVSGQAEEDFTTYALNFPWGWSIIYLGIAVLLFMVIGGRRFGKPVTSFKTGRSSTEYVSSLATLLRHSDSKQDVLGHYQNNLRRTLIKRFGIQPPVTDEAFAHISSIDVQKVIRLLTVQACMLSARELLEVTKEIQELTQDLELKAKSTAG